MLIEGTTAESACASLEVHSCHKVTAAYNKPRGTCAERMKRSWEMATAYASGLDSALEDALEKAFKGGSSLNTIECAPCPAPDWSVASWIPRVLCSRSAK